MCERHFQELCDLDRGTPEFEAFRRRLGLSAEAVASPERYERETELVTDSI